MHQEYWTASWGLTVPSSGRTRLLTGDQIVHFTLYSHCIWSMKIPATDAETCSPIKSTEIQYICKSHRNKQFQFCIANTVFIIDTKWQIRESEDQLGQFYVLCFQICKRSVPHLVCFILSCFDSFVENFHETSKRSLIEILELPDCGWG